jgi:hypothetical protein
MKHVLGAMAMPAPPQNAKQLLEGLAKIWADKPGGRTRQIQMQCIPMGGAPGAHKPSPRPWRWRTSWLWWMHALILAGVSASS